jgi:two-component system cell cycle sensor histidine kinase/response regulator CckA
MRGDKAEKRTVLVVDDDPSVLNVLRGVLDRAGYEVLSAGDAVAALEQFEGRRAPVSLLLTDVVMPGMSGMELANRLVVLDPKLKILLIAGLPDHPQVIASVMQKGFSFLPKPFHPKQLVAKVKEILGESQGLAASGGL